MVILSGFFIMLIVVVVLGIFQTLGETRLTWIFPAISVVAVLFVLSRCMFAAPPHH